MSAHDSDYRAGVLIQAAYDMIDIRMVQIQSIDQRARLEGGLK